MPRGNPQYLHTPTSEEAREIGRKGGLASAAKRRNQKNIRQLAQMLLKSPVVGDKNKKILEEMGFKGDDATNAAALVVRFFNKAMRDEDERASRYVTDLAGFSSAEMLRMAEQEDTVDEEEVVHVYVPNDGRNIGNDEDTIGASAEEKE